MSDINIEKEHNFSVDEAKEIIEGMVDGIATRFKGSYKLNDDNLTFTAPGINGQINLFPGKMQFSAKLGFLMKPLKSVIEKQVHDGFEDVLKKYHGSIKSKNKVKI